MLDEGGKEVTVIMGSYGIGVERILCAAVELYSDKNGMSLPASIAPFTLVVTPVNVKDEALRTAAEGLYAEANKAGLDTVMDDRDERPGVKFKDAEFGPQADLLSALLFDPRFGLFVTGPILALALAAPILNWRKKSFVPWRETLTALAVSLATAT